MMFFVDYISTLHLLQLGPELEVVELELDLLPGPLVEHPGDAVLKVDN